MFKIGDYVKITIIGIHADRIGRIVDGKYGETGVNVKIKGINVNLYCNASDLQKATTEELHSFKLEQAGNAICLK